MAKPDDICEPSPTHNGWRSPALAQGDVRGRLARGWSSRWPGCASTSTGSPPPAWCAWPGSANYRLDTESLDGPPNRQDPPRRRHRPGRATKARRSSLRSFSGAPPHEIPSKASSVASSWRHRVGVRAGHRYGSGRSTSHDRFSTTTRLARPWWTRASWTAQGRLLARRRRCRSMSPPPFPPSSPITLAPTRWFRTAARVWRCIGTLLLPRG